MKTIDQSVEEALDFVKSYGASIREWKVLKQELLRNLSPQKRKLFSRRDPRTKIQNFNEFEKTVVERWKQITGDELIISL